MSLADSLHMTPTSNTSDRSDSRRSLDAVHKDTHGSMTSGNSPYQPSPTSVATTSSRIPTPIVVYEDVAKLRTVREEFKENYRLLQGMRNDTLDVLEERGINIR